MRKLLYFFCFSAALALSACSGDDGAIGPKGDTGDKGADGAQGPAGEQGIPGEYSAKVGYFEGTIDGHRKDGTAFSEPFKYEFAFGTDVFDGNNLDLNRFETLGGAIAYKTTQLASSVDKGYALFSTFIDVSPWETNDFQFGFVKEFSATSLFVVNARAYLREENYDIVIELTPEKNAIYNLNMTDPGGIWYTQADTDGDEISDAWMFQINGTDKFLYYSMDNGSLLHVETSEGRATSGEVFDKYNALKFVAEESLESMVFVNSADNSPAWEYVETVPADGVEITNFVNQDGVISFDYTITISKYRGYLKGRGWGGYVGHGLNTTRHDLTITGKFNSGGKVYESTVGRRG